LTKTPRANPYLKKPEDKPKVPLVMRLPMYDFEDGHTMEAQLLLGECCFARMKNTKPTGFSHHVALVYKDEEGKVYSIGAVQHNGELKDTLENHKILHGEDPNDNGTNEKNDSHQSKESTAGIENKDGQEKPQP